MGYLLLGGIAGVCAVGWFFSRLSAKIIIFYMKEKGYTLPTDAELKACSRKATEDTFTFGWKNKR